MITIHDSDSEGSEPDLFPTKGCRSPPQEILNPDVQWVSDNEADDFAEEGEEEGEEEGCEEGDDGFSESDGSEENNGERTGSFYFSPEKAERVDEEKDFIMGFSVEDNGSKVVPQPSNQDEDDRMLQEAIRLSLSAEFMPTNLDDHSPPSCYQSTQTHLRVSGQFGLVEKPEFNKPLEPSNLQSPPRSISNIRGILQSVFRHTSFRDNQQEAIEAILEGKDVVLVLATGSGKSLIYQLPPMLKQRLAIVVSPLIALMQNQVYQCTRLGIRAAMLSSAQSTAEREAVIRDLRVRPFTPIRVLYVAPESVDTMTFQSLLREIAHNLCLIAVDEAHCISEWGHDFRPTYRRLRVLKTIAPSVPLLAVTATATRTIQTDVSTSLGMVNPRVLLGSFNRPNIRYLVRYKAVLADVNLDLLQVIQTQFAGVTGIVYCFTREETVSVASYLSANGLAVKPYHAGLPIGVRKETLQQWLTGRIRVVVATIAFGMGIDKHDVRFVIHYDLPSSFEALYQESGRAGRDGLPSTHLLYYSAEDANRRRKLVMRNTKRGSPARTAGLQTLSEVERFCLANVDTEVLHEEQEMNANTAPFRVPSKAKPPFAEKPRSSPWTAEEELDLVQEIQLIRMRAMLPYTRNFVQMAARRPDLPRGSSDPPSASALHTSSYGNATTPISTASPNAPSMTVTAQRPVASTDAGSSNGAAAATGPQSTFLSLFSSFSQKSVVKPPPPVCPPTSSRPLSVKPNTVTSSVATSGFTSASSLLVDPPQQFTPKSQTSSFLASTKQPVDAPKPSFAKLNVKTVPVCRRTLLLRYFGETWPPISSSSLTLNSNAATGHRCCDVCEESSVVLALLMQASEYGESFNGALGGGNRKGQKRKRSKRGTKGGSGKRQRKPRQPRKPRAPKAPRIR